MSGEPHPEEGAARPRLLRLSAEYGCWPVWDQTRDVGANLDPEDLPISAALRHRLVRWSEAHARTLDEAYPPDSAFATAEEERRWVEEGRALRAALEEELGPGVRVEYRHGSRSSDSPH